MIVHLMNGKLDWEINGKSIECTINIQRDIKYKITLLYLYC